MRAFPLRVIESVRLSEHFVRISLAGDSLCYFGTADDGATRDLRIKLIIPSPGHAAPEFGALDDGWYQEWVNMDPARRGFMRTYTVRALREDPVLGRVLDVDFVLHAADSGPACRWATAARPGDAVTVLGPNAEATECVGIEFRPGHAQRVLLAGDETAVPAIAGILATLPPEVSGHAVLEVPSALDFLDLPAPRNVKIQWLARGAGPHGVALRDAVADVIYPAVCARGEEPQGVDMDADLLWETPVTDPAGGMYAWVAGEAAMVRELRRYLVRETGMDRAHVAFMGYWRRGSPLAP
ncbi:MAG: siderophore-interacting protein [Acidobacteria bacterium]|nr:siderophore-interacting protein [Acidobacteriota bacterium]